MNSGRIKSIGDQVSVIKLSGAYKIRPRYSIILHDVREKLDLSLNTYVVVDSVHKLSSSDPNFPYCVMSKMEMADFLDLSERTVYRALNDAEHRGLIQRTGHGLRATEQWIGAVEIYSIHKR
jgi:hypothetical protein